MALRQFFDRDDGINRDPDKPSVVLSIDTEWTPIPHEAPKDLVPDVVQLSDGDHAVILQCSFMQGDSVAGRLSPALPI